MLDFIVSERFHENQLAELAFTHSRFHSPRRVEVRCWLLTRSTRVQKADSAPPLDRPFGPTAFTSSR